MTTKRKTGANKVSTKAIKPPKSGKVTISEEREPEPIVEIHEEGGDVETSDKPVTFFSRWREDQLVMEQAYTEQVGSNKWVTHPAKVCAFRDRAFVTNDKEKIEFIRAHPRYGIELFEFGVPDHNERISQIDDAGRILELEKLGRLGRIMESQIRRGLAS